MAAEFEINSGENIQNIYFYIFIEILDNRFVIHYNEHCSY